MKLAVVTLMFLLTLGMKAQNPDFLFMIEQAIKAPSGHNTQPWKFKINESSIEIHPNFEKILPVVDADNRELFISLGCATENLCLAASERGYLANVRIEGETIHIGLSQSGKPETSELFRQIALRQTNRSIYKEKTISNDTISLLKQTILHETTQVHFYERGSTGFSILKDLVVQGNVLQMNDSAFTNELKSWMRFNKKQTMKSNDGLSYAAFGAPNLPGFISKPIISSFLKAEKQNEGDIKKMDSSPYFVLFTTSASTIEGWINLGRDLQHFLLLTTQMGISNAYLNQPCELPELVLQVEEKLSLTPNVPNILLRIGYADKMPYSQRKAVQEVLIQ